MALELSLNRPVAGSVDGQQTVNVRLDGVQRDWNLFSDSLEAADVRVSFWGQRQLRCVYDGGYVILSLEDVASKVAQLARLCPQGYNISRLDRRTGTIISNTLLNQYAASDRLIENSWFTRLLVFLREFHFFTPTTRDYFSYDAVAQSNFLTYTEANFRDTFGQAILNAERHLQPIPLPLMATPELLGREV